MNLTKKQMGEILLKCKNVFPSEKMYEYAKELDAEYQGKIAAYGTWLKPEWRVKLAAKSTPHWKGVVAKQFNIPPNLRYQLAKEADKDGIYACIMDTEGLTSKQYYTLAMLLPVKLRWEVTMNCQYLKAADVLKLARSLGKKWRGGIAIFAWNLSDKQRVELAIESGVRSDCEELAYGELSKKWLIELLKYCSKFCRQCIHTNWNWGKSEAKELGL